MKLEKYQQDKVIITQLVVSQPARDVPGTSPEGPNVWDF